MFIYVEVDDPGDGLPRMIRVHKQYYSDRRSQLKKGLEKIECQNMDMTSEFCYAIEIEPDETVQDRSGRDSRGIVYTDAPDQYGDPDARLQAGKKAPVKIPWGEWVCF